MKKGNGNIYLLFWTIEVLLFIFWGLRILNEKPVFMAFHNGELMGGLPGGLVYGEMTPAVSYTHLTLPTILLV